MEHVVFLLGEFYMWHESCINYKKKILSVEFQWTVARSSRLAWGDFPPSTNQSSNDKDSSPGCEASSSPLWLFKFLFFFFFFFFLPLAIQARSTPEAQFD